MQFHLSRYAYLLESSLLSDAVTLVPKESSEGIGLKAIMESIDNRSDFKAYVQNYRVVHQGSGRGPRRDGPAEQGFVRIPYLFQLFTYTLPVTSSRPLHTTLTD
jgi:Rho GTPase-activating protein RGD1